MVGDIRKKKSNQVWIIIAAPNWLFIDVNDKKIFFAGDTVYTEK